MTEPKDFGDEVKQAITIFFKKHGGMANGYGTWLDGEVRKYGLRDSLKWHTPEAGEMRVKDMQEASLRLFLQLSKMLENSDYDRILFTRQYLDHGCFNIRIQLIKDVLGPPILQDRS